MEIKGFHRHTITHISLDVCLCLSLTLGFVYTRASPSMAHSARLPPQCHIHLECRFQIVRRWRCALYKSIEPFDILSVDVGLCPRVRMQSNERNANAIELVLQSMRIKIIFLSNACIR